MSEESENDSDISLSNSHILIGSEYDEMPLTVTKPMKDEEPEFIYDDDFCKLICVGINFDDIPLNILHDYSLKTKVNLSFSMFLDCPVCLDSWSKWKQFSFIILFGQFS